MGDTAIGTLAVRIAAITGPFEAAIQDAAKEIKKLSSAAAEVAKVSGASLAGLTGMLTLVTHESSEAQKAQMQLAGAFRASGKSFDSSRFQAFANAVEDVSTTSSVAVEHMGALMASFGLSQNTVQALIPGVVNLSSVTGQAADAVAEKLAVAIESGSANLNRYGIVLNASEKKTFEFASTSERAAMLMQKMGAFQGAAAEAASTASGRFTQMVNALEHVGEEVGNIVNKPLASIFDAVKDAAKGVTSALAALSPHTKEMIADFLLGATAVAGLVTAIAGIMTAVGFVTPALIAIGTAIATIGAPVLGVVAALSAVVLALGWVQKYGAAVWDWLGAKARAVANDIKTIWVTVTDSIGKAWGWLRDTIVNAMKAAWDWIAAKFPKLASLVSGAVSAAGDAISSVAQSVMGSTGSVWDAVASGTVSTLRDMRNIGEATFIAIGEFGKAAAVELGDEFMRGIGVIKSAFSGLNLGLKMGGSGSAATSMPAGTVDGGGSISDKLTNEVASMVASSMASAGSTAQQSIVQSLQDTSKAYADAANATHDVALKAQYLAKAGELANKAKEQQDNPNAGGLADAAIKGYMQGGGGLFGIISAIIAVVGSILSKLKGFADLLALLQPVIDNIMKILNPIMQIIVSITSLFQKIADCGVEPAVEALAWVLGKIADAITAAVNWVFHRINDVLGVFGVHISDVGSGAGGSGPSMPAYQQAADSAAANAAQTVAQNDIKNGRSASQAAADYANAYAADFAKFSQVWQEAFNQTQDEAAATAIATQALTDMTTAANAVTASLQNVPTGFNELLAEWNAMSGLPSPLAHSSGGASGLHRVPVSPLSGLLNAARTPDIGEHHGGTKGIGGIVPVLNPDLSPFGVAPVHVEHLIVQAEDPAQLAQKLQRLGDWKQFVQTGTTVRTGSPFAGPQRTQ